MSKVKTISKFILSAKKIHGNKYDYSKTIYINSKIPVIIICKNKKHGYFEFSQIPNSHTTKGHGCPKCSNCYRYNTEEIIDIFKSKHKDRYDYSKVLYSNTHKKVSIICKKHGIFKQSPHNHIIGQGCKKCGTDTVKLKLRETTNDFIKKAIKVHENKYDYSNVHYINSTTLVIINCKIRGHGKFKQIPHIHLSGNGCRKCSGNEKIDTKKFIKRANKIHGSKYNYDKVYYINSETKVLIKCIKHNFEFSQTPNSHTGQMKSGCIKCYRERQSEERRYKLNDFIKKAIKIHNIKYDYSLVSELNFKMSNSIEIICPKHGKFTQKAQVHINGCGCQKCSESKGERQIRVLLENNNIDYIMEKSFDGCISPISNKKLNFDFYLPKLNICIEFDGGQHFKPVEYFGGKKGFDTILKLDNVKNIFCKKNKIELIRIPFDKDIYESLNNILKP